MTELFGSLLSSGMAPPAKIGESFWFPVSGSTVSGEVDWVFYFILWIAVFFFVLIVALMALFIFVYRRGADAPPGEAPSHSLPLEIIWTAIPVVLLSVTFYLGLKGYMNLNTPPSNSYQILVTAQKWSWLFTYPNGYVDETLHVPRNTPVSLTMTSEDVIHGFFVPAFRIKRDVSPGRYSKAWFNATQLGQFDIFCSQYCGRGHSTMHSHVIVQTPGEYNKWLANAADYLMKASPAEAGARLFKTRGCAQCHSLDGTVGTGPPLNGVFGTAQRLEGGKTATADENYIRESIQEPQAKVVKGYQPVMPTFKGRLTDREITALIEFLKTQRATVKKP